MARKKGRFNAIASAESVTLQAPGRIYRTALYARLSVELANRPSNSIESQMDIMKAYVREHPELAQFQEYTDNGFTGTNFNRPAFTKMMEDVRNGKINCILVKDLSRFGRDYLETTNYIEIILPFLGVRFISVNDHFDTDAESNENKALEVALKNLVNDMYAKDVSKRRAVVAEQEMVRGKFTGSNAPYGYIVNKEDPLRHYLVDEPAAEVVRDIYRMAAEGKPLRQIFLVLQERNLSIPGQYLKTGHLYQEEGDPIKIWHVGTIGNILRNPAYIGNLVNGRRRARLYENEKRHFTDKEEWVITENTHEPIIDQETYDKVRALFAKKVEQSNYSSDRGKDIPIKKDKYFGLLYCGSCGKRLRLNSFLEERDGVLIRTYYFQCPNTYDHSNPDRCRTGIREWKVDKVVYSAMKAQVAAAFEQEDLIGFCETTFAEKLRPLEDAVKKIRRQIEKIDYDGSRHYEDYVMGKFSRAQMEALQRESSDSVKKLEATLSEAENRYAERKKELDGVLQAVKAIHEMDGRVDLTKELLQMMVDKIVVFSDGHLDISWRFREWFSGVSEKYGKWVRDDEEVCDISAAV